MLGIIAMHKEIEKIAQSDEIYRREMKESGRLFYSEILALPEETLFNRLKEGGIGESPEFVKEALKNALSLREVYQDLVESNHLSFDDPWDEELTYLFLIALWKKNPSSSFVLENFEEFLYDGYEAIQEIDDGDAPNKDISLAYWEKAGNVLIFFIERLKLTDKQVKEIFEDHFEIRPWLSLFFETAFLSAEKEHLDFVRFLCERLLDFYGESKEDFMEIVVLNYAQSFYEANQVVHGHQYFRKTLEKRPKWKVGWLKWADNYTFGAKEYRDKAKAMGILYSALESVEEKDTLDILPRLIYLHQEEGDLERSKDLKKRLERLSQKYSERERQREETGPDLFPPSFDEG